MEALAKSLKKAKNVIKKAGIPGFYFKTLAFVEDGIKDITRAAQKKMNARNAKALNKVRSSIKKLAKVRTQCGGKLDV